MLELDDAAINRLCAKFDSFPSEIKRAGNIAAEKAANWMKEEATKVICEQVNINPAVFDNRVYASTDRENIRAKVYIGTRTVNFIRLNPRQTATGVQAGDITIDHAFIAPARSGSSHKLVYLRNGKSRLPLNKMVLNVSKTSQEVIQSLLKEAMTVLTENIRQELKLNGQ